MSKTPDKPPAQPGEHDTVRIKALPEPPPPAPEKPADPVEPGVNPYSSADTRLVPYKRSRRTLDDMRKLSEEIRRRQTRRRTPR